MKACHVCPHCGYDIALDTPMLINDFVMNGPSFPLLFRGEVIPLTNGERQVVWALLKNYPSEMTTIALSERIGNEPEDADAAVKVLIHRVRRKFAEVGAPENTIFTVRGRHSYRWSTGAEHVQADKISASA